MGNRHADADRALIMGLVHEVFPDETFEADVMAFCRHLAKQNLEQMGTAKIAIELAAEVGRDQGRHIERLANSALMLHPDYLEGLRRYVQGVGGAAKG
jgi:enoyl-CoA hydratase/carnithine racemase